MYRAMNNRGMRLTIAVLLSLTLIWTSMFAFGGNSRAYANEEKAETGDIVAVEDVAAEETEEAAAEDADVEENEEVIAAEAGQEADLLNAAEGTMISNAVNVSFGRQYFKAWTKDTDHLNHYCKITVPSDGFIKISATKPYDDEGEYGKMDFTVFNPDGDILWGNGCSYSVDGVLDSYNMYVGLKAGTYYMTIKPGFSVWSGLIETYYTVTHTPNAYTEKESNEGLSDATPLTLGKTYTGYFGSDGYDDAEENDVYKFKLTKGESYKIAFGNYSKFTAKTAMMCLIEPSGNEDNITWDLENKVDGNGNNYITYKAPTTGTYYFRLENYGKEQLKYTLSIKHQAKKTQKITTGANSYKKKANANDFNLNAKAKGKLSYSSSNKNICTVTKKGKVTVWGVGKATITIKAAATGQYKAATKKVTITVLRPAPPLKSAVNIKGKKMKVKWDARVAYMGDKNYQIQYATNSKFTKNKKTVNAKTSVDSKTIGKLKKNKTYWVRMRVKVKGEDGKTYYSPWSKTKKVKIKK